MEFITSSKNNVVKHISKLFQNKKYRKEHNLLACEGKKMLLEAFECGVEIDIILATEEKISEIENINAKKYIVPEHIIKSVSDTKTPQGILFTCFMKDWSDEKIEDFEKIIILDNLKDPGNMGTIIRTASAFFVDGIIILGDSVDITNPKVIRSTMGSVFKTPILNLSYEDCFEKIKVPVYATYLDKTSQSINDINLKKSAVIIGNEANGVSDMCLEKCDGKIIIPMNENTESLNASIACSIVMWEMSKK